MNHSRWTIFLYVLYNSKTNLMRCEYAKSIRHSFSSHLLIKCSTRTAARQCCKWRERKTKRIYINILDAVHVLARSHFSSIYDWIFKSVCAHRKHSWKRRVFVGLFSYVRPTHVYNDDLRCEAGRRRRCQASVKYFVHFSSRRVHFSNRLCFVFLLLLFSAISSTNLLC